MKNTVAIFFFFFLLSCFEVKAQTDKYIFKDNLASFDNYLTEIDSLIVNVDLRICDGTHYEKLIFTKQNDTVFIQGKAQADYHENVVLKKIPYLILERDSLNFENLFLKRIDRNIVKRKTSSFVYEIVNSQGDTLRLFNDGLVDKIDISRYHFKIMNRLYPSEELYIPLEVPPEPKDTFPEFKLKIK